jgi:hypothetical protein
MRAKRMVQSSSAGEEEENKGEHEQAKNKRLVRGCCTISWDQQRKEAGKAREVKDQECEAKDQGLLMSGLALPSRVDRPKIRSVDWGKAEALNMRC